MTTRLDRTQARRYADGLMQQINAADTVGVRDADTEAARSRLAGIRSALAAGARIVTINNGVVAREVADDDDTAGQLVEGALANPSSIAAVTFTDPPVKKTAPKPTPPKRETPTPDGMVFRDPPPSQNPRVSRGTVWPQKFAALRARPGKWALVHVGNASQASNIKRGELGDATRGEFDACARKRPDGKHDVYARYIGA